METKENWMELDSPYTRRNVLLGTALGIGSLAIAPLAKAGLTPGIAEPQDAIDKSLKTFLHQEIEILAHPSAVYEALMDSKKFAAFTGMPATIHREEGGTLSMFKGIISGRNIELVKDKRIVQAWRPNHWDAGVYSVVKFELAEHGSGTRLVLDHTGFPIGSFESLDSGWGLRYWTPLKKYLA